MTNTSAPGTLTFTRIDYQTTEAVIRVNGRVCAYVAARRVDTGPRAGEQPYYLLSYPMGYRAPRRFARLTDAQRAARDDYARTTAEAILGGSAARCLPAYGTDPYQSMPTTQLALARDNLRERIPTESDARFRVELADAADRLDAEIQRRASL